MENPTESNLNNIESVANIDAKMADDLGIVESDSLKTQVTKMTQLLLQVIAILEKNGLVQEETTEDSETA